MNETALIPLTLQDTLNLGDVLVKSGFFADAKQASQAVVKVLAGRELGFGPIASMTGINIVQGKPAIGANLMAAAIKASGKYNFRIVRLDNDVCEIAFFEHNQEVGRSAFTIEDAKRAGLDGKDNWRKFPRNMLFARALSNGARWYCPDAGNGVTMYTPEELGDEAAIIDVTPTPVETRNEPAPKADKPAETNGKTKQAGVKSQGWANAATTLAHATPYFMRGDQVDWYHLTGAAAKLGFVTITDENLDMVIDALRTYANQKEAEARQESLL